VLQVLSLILHSVCFFIVKCVLRFCHIFCMFQGMKDVAKDKNKQKTAEEVKAESLK
jgi:hypothetical protein